MQLPIPSDPFFALYWASMVNHNHAFAFLIVLASSQLCQTLPLAKPDSSPALYEPPCRGVRLEKNTSLIMPSVKFMITCETLRLCGNHSSTVLHDYFILLFFPETFIPSSPSWCLADDFAYSCPKKIEVNWRGIRSLPPTSNFPRPPQLCLLLLAQGHLLSLLCILTLSLSSGSFLLAYKVLF